MIEVEDNGFGENALPSDEPDYPRVVELERTILSLSIERDEAKRALDDARVQLGSRAFVAPEMHGGPPPLLSVDDMVRKEYREACEKLEIAERVAKNVRADLEALRERHAEVSKRAYAASIEAILYKEGVLSVEALLRLALRISPSGFLLDREAFVAATTAWLEKMGLEAPDWKWTPIEGDPTFEPIRHETRPVDLSAPLGTFGFPKTEGEKASNPDGELLVEAGALLERGISLAVVDDKFNAQVWREEVRRWLAKKKGVEA